MALPARGPDDPPALPVDHRHCAAIGQGIGKEGAEHRLLPAIMRGMDRPYLPVAGHGEQGVPIGGSEGPQQQPIPFKDRLPIHQAETSATAAMNLSMFPIVRPATLMRPDPAM